MRTSSSVSAPCWPSRRDTVVSVWLAPIVLAGGLFLFRDAAGGSPGKKLFGLRLVRKGGSASGPAASFARNVMLLVPGWNLVEIASVIRRRDGRRPGDKLAGTTLVEA